MLILTYFTFNLTEWWQNIYFYRNLSFDMSSSAVNIIHDDHNSLDISVFVFKRLLHSGNLLHIGQFHSSYEKNIGEDLVFNNALPKSLIITQIASLKAKPKLHNGMVYRQFIMIPVVLIGATNYVYKCITT